MSGASADAGAPAGAEPASDFAPGVPAPAPPYLHLGDATAWLRVERAGADDRTRRDTWRLTCEWHGHLSAAFESRPLARRDIHTFATKLRAGIAAGAPFSLPLAEEDRHNPLRLHALPAGSRGHGFHLRLTPHGQDTANHLDMEIAPVASETLLAEIDTFLRNLV
ncbi:hypothetical protein [Streptomyces sp. NPDC051561]|uniref:hypothetical protein n=1 Tax=Streptomyces sp. NPDC051561 TaxID=3365658 RepID=UPI0037AB4840